MNDRDLRIRQFAAQRLRETAQSGLGCRIGGESGKWQRTEGGTDIDDRCLRLCAQPGQERMGEAQRRGQAGPQYLLDAFPLLLFDQTECARAGVVDQHVDASHLRSTADRRNAFRCRQVGGDNRRPRGQFGAKHLQLGDIAPCQQQGGAGRRKLAGEFLTQTAAGAGQ